jgi:DNA-binding PadR family transcriptional regulator
MLKWRYAAMNIKYAILGLLSSGKMTGYDLKKTMEASPLLHWSGNNSQIYRTLAELSQNGLVAAEVLHEEDAPTKKQYTLTQSGQRELLELSRLEPAMPELRLQFAVQLAFASDLSQKELEAMLAQYESEVQGVLIAIKKEVESDAMTGFARKMQNITSERLCSFYEGELAWASQIRSEALPLVVGANINNEVNEMKFTKMTANSQTYVMITAGQITREEDAVVILSACAEHDTNSVLLPSACLSEDFLRLSSRLLGLVLGKLSNYRVKTAAVLDMKEQSQRMKEFLYETNHGNEFRTFESQTDAENWLTGGKTQ